MIFERPEVLVWLPAAAVLLALGIAAQWQRTNRMVRAYGGREATRRLTGRNLGRIPVARAACGLFAAVALVMSAAGARRDPGEPPPPPTPLDLIVAVDLSHSMTAADVQPSRAERARAVVRRVLEERVADRVALTLFASWPYGLVPVTDDLAVVEWFTPWIDPGLVDARQQGTSFAAAVDHAAELRRARARPDGLAVLLIVSDGESHGEGGAAVDAVTRATEDGMRIWTAGVGTAAGAPLTVPGSTAPLLEGSGRQAASAADFDLLREMARAGGGGFHDVGSDRGVDGLVDDLRILRGSQVQTEQPEFDPTALLLLVALALLTAEGALDMGRRAPRDRADARWSR